MRQAVERVKGEFRIPASRIFLIELMRHGFWLILGLVVLFLVGILLGIVLDIRALVVAFMVPCLIAPMAMSFFFMKYCLHPDEVVNTLPHTLRIEGDRLIVRIRTSPDRSDDEKDSEEESDDDIEPQYREHIISLDRVLPPQATSSGLFFPLKGGGAVIVPDR